MTSSVVRSVWRGFAGGKDVLSEEARSSCERLVRCSTPRETDERFMTSIGSMPRSCWSRSPQCCHRRHCRSRCGSRDGRPARAAGAFDRPDPLGCRVALPTGATGAGPRRGSDALFAPPPGEAVDSDWDVDAGAAARPRSTAVRTGSGSCYLHDATAPPSGFDQGGRYSRVEARSTMRMTRPEPRPRLASRDEATAKPRDIPGRGRQLVTDRRSVSKQCHRRNDER